MLILVSGGSGSGKSAFAEDLIVSSGLETKIYVATMQVWDAEGQARVDRHRAMRAGKGFATLECPENLAGLTLPLGCAALLEARKHCGWYMTGLRGAAALRRQAGTVSTPEDVRALARAALAAREAGDKEESER